MGFFDDLFGNQSDAFDDYENQMRDAAQRYQPWVDRGNQAGSRVFDEYGRLISNPNAVQDQVAAGFNMSPYQQYLLDQITKRMNYNSANTGMTGSGAADRALAAEINNMTGQFENDYINRGLGLYNTGLQGMAGLNEMGLRALDPQSNLLEQAAAARLKSQQSSQGAMANMFGQVGGAIVGGLFGGAAGAGVGSKVGKNAMGGNNMQPSQLPNYNVGNWSY